MTQTDPGPDHLLVPEQLHGLNRAFYATKPWEYFNHRNHLLMLVAGAGDRLREIAVDGVTYRGLEYRETPDEDGADDPEAEDARERFILADSEALLHHASETLLRLYLAHEGRKPCPWLEMARVRNPAQFKRMVTERFLGDLSRHERRNRIGHVFFGAADRTNLKPAPSEQHWLTGLDNIEAFLVHFSSHFINADVYNSLKHGLAVRPGDVKTQLDQGELIKAEGPAIEYLTIRRDEHDRRRWNRSTTWIRPDHSMGLVFLAARLMNSLWDIGKYRYVGEKPAETNLWVTPLYEDVMKRLEDGENARVFVDSMHMELAYFADPSVEGPIEGEPL